MNATRFSIQRNAQLQQASRKNSRRSKTDQNSARKNREDAAALDISEDLQAAIIETNEHDKRVKVKREYRNRIKTIYTYWMESLPKYAFKVNRRGEFVRGKDGERVLSANILKLSDEEKNDKELFHYKNDYDINYDTINPMAVKAFLASEKRKENGFLCSHVSLRKYHNAIQFGAAKAAVKLPDAYHTEIKQYLAAFKKEKASQSQIVDLKEENENDADPIPWALFILLCQWQLLEGNIFGWVFSLLQWNCMGRSINIDPLGLSNLSPGNGGDSIVVKYFKNKADQVGAKTTPKNCYANPFDPRVSLFLAVGVWISLNQDKFNHSDKLFLNKGSAVGSASHSYCESLKNVVKTHEGEVKKYMVPKKCKSHGTRKGIATKVSTKITVPPPLLSIFSRGEWSVGQIVDIYFKFGDAGDCYLGRCAAGLDPESPDFKAMPPHFDNNEDSEYFTENEGYIQEGLTLCFGKVGEKHNCEWLTRLLLGSIVYHASYLQALLEKSASNPIRGIALLGQPNLLEKLKDLVTIESSSLITRATGIPPHIEHNTQLRSAFDILLANLNKLSSLADSLHDSVKDGFRSAAEEFARSNGHVTAGVLDEIFGKFKEDIRQEISDVNSKITDLLRQKNNSSPFDDDILANITTVTEQTEVVDSVDQLIRMFHYNNRVWMVPANYSFPTGVQRKAGWHLWLKGDERKHVRPFRMLAARNLPKNMASSFKRNWKPIFKAMELGVKNLPQDTRKLTAEEIEKAYNEGTAYLKERYSFIFDSRKKYDTWALSTWSNQISQQNVLKNGTNKDKSLLPENTRFNRPHADGRKKRKWEKKGPLQRAKKKQKDEGDTRSCNDSSDKSEGDKEGEETREGGERVEESNNMIVNSESQESNDKSNEANKKKIRRKAIQTLISPRKLRSGSILKRKSLPGKRKEVTDTNKRDGSQSKRTKTVETNNFASAFAIPPRPPEIEKQIRAREKAHQKKADEEREKDKSLRRSTQNRVGDAVSTGGDVLFVQRPRRRLLRETTKKRFKNQCPIEGCDFEAAPPDHTCYNYGCKIQVHNLCAQRANLCSAKNEVNMYCCIECKIEGDSNS